MGFGGGFDDFQPCFVIFSSKIPGDRTASLGEKKDIGLVGPVNWRTSLPNILIIQELTKSMIPNDSCDTMMMDTCEIAMESTLHDIVTERVIQ